MLLTRTCFFPICLKHLFDSPTIHLWHRFVNIIDLSGLCGERSGIDAENADKAQSYAEIHEDFTRGFIDRGVPVFPSTERAVHALEALVRYAALRGRSTNNAEYGFSTGRAAI